MSLGKISLCILLYVLLEMPLLAQVQVAPGRYRVDFTDKNNNTFTLDRPNEFLSDRALQRRSKQNIIVTEADLPVTASYIQAIVDMGIPVLNTSRWFNSAVVRCSAAEAAELSNLPFIKQTVAIRSTNVVDTVQTKDKVGSPFSFSFEERVEIAASVHKSIEDYYGQAATQVEMLNGHLLHNNGYRGRGMLIAVIDIGFYNADILSGFSTMRDNGRLLGVKNFTQNPGVYGDRDHGTNVLSIIGSDLPGQMVGSAPDATYTLLRSEEYGGEYIVEEENWISAAEYADSLGVDLITSSLGYSKFDDASQNYVYADLDGHTSRSSLAATMAVACGIIVCISAGNDGNSSSWKYISVPADADSIVTVGAVNRNRQYASFSSVGPTADKRVKPDLTAMGSGTAFQSSSGNINTGTGTSYSTPLLAGFLACLWQAYPNKSNMEIIEMARCTADHYNEPDSLYGYGIPDFSQLVTSSASSDFVAPKMNIFPNPFTGTFTLNLSPAQYGTVSIRIFTITGQLMYSHTAYVSGYNTYEIEVLESINFPAGIYIVETRTDVGRFTGKAIKQ